MKKLCSLVICVMALLFVGCEPNTPATSSKLETGTASDITTESVVLHGVVNVDISQYEDVEFGMMVSEDKAELNAHDGEMYKAKVLIGKDFELTIYGLSPETKYYYCAWVFLNNTQYEFGVIKEFTTLAQKIDGIGTFSVSDSKQVTFSPGNLQRHVTTYKWSFADNQYDYFGEANIDEYGLAYHVDLFGWSTSTTYFGLSASRDYKDYSGSFVDWGTNSIENYAPNTWRTLSYDEWRYLRYHRTNANDLYGLAQVNGVNGMVFLPDNWTCPAGVTFKSGFHYNSSLDYYAAYQTFTVEQWSKLESAGAVFLPAAGFRSGSKVYGVQDVGFYWSATEIDSINAYCLSIGSGAPHMDTRNRDSGHSVRLVKDLQ